MNAAERVLLLLDVARTATGIHESGVHDVAEGGMLGDVMRRVRGILSGRGAKSSPLGKLAVARYQRLVNHVRTVAKLYGRLDFSLL